MNDLISRQAAIDALDERCESECEYSKKQRSIMCDACYLGSAKEVIEALPTIDAVPVVRCKDCVYWRHDDCQNDNHGFGPINENDFCSWGERKDEVDE